MVRRREDPVDGGFTLVEVLVVVVILAVLSAVVILSVTRFSQRSAVASCRIDVRTVKESAGTYVAKSGRAASALELVPDYVKSWPSSGDYSVTGRSGFAVSEMLNEGTPCDAG